MAVDSPNGPDTPDETGAATESGKPSNADQKAEKARRAKRKQKKLKRKIRHLEQELAVYDSVAASKLYGLTPELEREVAQALSEDNPRQLYRLVRPLHAADHADLIERYSGKARERLVTVLGRYFDPETLTYLDDRVREEVIPLLDEQVLRAAFQKLESDDAVGILGELDEEDQARLLDALPERDRAIVEEGLTYEEESAGRLMQRELVTVPEHWTVGQTIDFAPVMADIEDRHVEFRPDAFDHPQDFLATSPVERGQGLVHQEKARSREQRTADRDPLCLAAGQRARHALEQMANAEKTDGNVEIEPAAFGWGELPAEQQILPHPPVRKQPAVLEHIAAGPALGRQIDPRLAVEQHCAGDHDPAAVRTDQTGDHVEQAGLSGARWPEQRDQPVLRGKAATQPALPAPEFDIDLKGHGRRHCPRNAARAIRKSPGRPTKGPPRSAPAGSRPPRRPGPARRCRSPAAGSGFRQGYSIRK